MDNLSDILMLLYWGTFLLSPIALVAWRYLTEKSVHLFIKIISEIFIIALGVIVMYLITAFVNYANEILLFLYWFSFSLFPIVLVALVSWRRIKRTSVHIIIKIISEIIIIALVSVIYFFCLWLLSFYLEAKEDMEQIEYYEQNYKNNSKDTIFDDSYPEDAQPPKRTINYDVIDITPGDSFNLNKLQDRGRVMMDVTFDGKPELLVMREGNDDLLAHCQYFDVYEYVGDSIRKITYEPYTSFKTQTEYWVLGYGTNINYVKKEIIVPSMGPESCSDYGTQIYDHYLYDEKTKKFKHHRRTKEYDFNE